MDGRKLLTQDCQIRERIKQQNYQHIMLSDHSTVHPELQLSDNAFTQPFVNNELLIVVIVYALAV